MKNQRTPRRVSSVAGFLWDVIARVTMRTLPRHLTPVPVPVRHRSTYCAARRTPPRYLIGWLPFLMGLVLLAASLAWASAAALPDGVPNIFDPSVQAHFQPVAMTNLEDNPDFPVVLLLNTTGQEPQTLLLGFDARNGKDTWSLTTDPIILIVVFADATRVQGVYVDTGFAGQGKASGIYAAVDQTDGSALPDLLKAVAATGKQNKI